MDLTLGHNGRFVKYLFGFFFGRGSGHDQAVSWPATITGGRGGVALWGAGLVSSILAQRGGRFVGDRWPVAHVVPVAGEPAQHGRPDFFVAGEPALVAVAAPSFFCGG